MMGGRTIEGFRHPGRMGQDLNWIASLEVAQEKPVGIVEVGKDQIEIADIIHPFRIEDSMRSEESAQRTVIYRADSVEVMAIQANLGKTGLAEHLDVGIGPAFAQEAESGQRYDEITESTATDNQNIHE